MPVYPKLKSIAVKIGLSLAVIAVMTSSGSLSAWQVRPSDPLASYLFDGDTNDVGNQFNGTNNGALFVGGLGNTPFQYAGNQALQFDGIDDFVEIADTAALRPGPGDWTLSVWFNAPASDQFGGLFAKRQSSGDFNQISIGIGGVMTFGTPGQAVGYAEVQHSFDRNIGRTNFDVVNSAWHHLALVKSPIAEPLFYLDGTLISGQSLVLESLDEFPPRDIFNTESWIIGALNSDLFFYDGLIDEPAMWNSALSPANIQWLAQNSLTTIPEPSSTTVITAICLLAILGRCRVRPIV